MFGIEWIKRLVARKPTPVITLGDRSRVAISQITSNKDGSMEESIFGTVNYGKGCEPESGHKPIYILGTTGVMRQSDAVQLAISATTEQINTDLQCFSPEGVKLLDATAKRASE